MTLRLLSYNIRYGGTGREEQLASVIRACAPDVVVFQEATRPHIVEQLAAATEMRSWGAQPGYSLGFLSRLEIASHQWRQVAGVRRACLELVPAGMELRIFGVHLSAIHSKWTESRRVGELRALLANIAQKPEDFHLLVGDFNTLAPGETLDIRRLPPRLRPLVWLSGGKIRWQTVQVMLDHGYVDGHRLLHADEPGYTFPTWDPHLRLDYLFLPLQHAERLIACQVITEGLAVQASDHFPLLSVLEVSKSNRQRTDPHGQT
jgi:endonuclease/exonuclease/phosphatase family metal-dependent hydrolase